MYQIKLSTILEDCKIVVSVTDSNNSGKSGLVKVELSGIAEQLEETTEVITSQGQKVIMNGTPKTGSNHTCSAHLIVDGTNEDDDGPKFVKLCSEDNE